MGIYLDYQEAWIYIKGHKTKYKICSSGKVLNTETGKYMKGGRDKNGYHIISLTYKKKKYTRKVHRLVALAFIPNPYDFPEVNHKDGDKWNNDVHNLEWVSSADNTHHAQDIGLRNQSLKKKDVEKICKMLSSGKYQVSKISAKTGVSKPLIRRILRRERWTSISNKYDFSKFFDKEKKPIGSSNNRSSITEIDAHIICSLIESGKTVNEINEKTGVSKRIIYCIRSGYTWKHISKRYNFH